MADQKKIKILLVDDDPMIRIYFNDVFWIHGLEDKYDILVVSGPEEAEKILKDPATRPEIVFLDLVMSRQIDGRTETAPEVGIDLLKKIKQDPELKNIRVIIFSSHTAPNYVEATKKAGADDYLVKGDHLPQDIMEVMKNLSERVTPKES